MIPTCCGYLAAIRAKNSTINPIIVSFKYMNSFASYDIADTSCTILTRCDKFSVVRTGIDISDICFVF